MMHANIRDYRVADAQALNSVALAAFMQFKDDYSDWPAMAANVSRMSDLASNGEIVLVEINGRVVGGVAYVPGGKPKRASSTNHGRSFECSWLIRHRGAGAL